MRHHRWKLIEGSWFLEGSKGTIAIIDRVRGGSYLVTGLNHEEIEAPLPTRQEAQKFCELALKLQGVIE